MTGVTMGDLMDPPASIDQAIARLHLATHRFNLAKAGRPRSAPRNVASERGAVLMAASDLVDLAGEILARKWERPEAMPTPAELDEIRRLFALNAPSRCPHCGDVHLVDPDAFVPPYGDPGCDWDRWWM